VTAALAFDNPPRLASPPLGPGRATLSGVRLVFSAPASAAPQIRTARDGRGRVPGVTDSAELERERLLCERAQKGDRDALASLLRSHGPRLYRSVLLPRLGSSAAAEEALSQTYVKVVERLAQFTWQNVGFYPWLRTVGLHVALDQLRRRRRETLFEPHDLERAIEQNSDSSAGAAELEQNDLAESRRRVEELLSDIHPRYALAIRRRVLEEQPREAVAAELGVSVATFDVVLHRAMAAIKKALAARGGAEP